MAEIIDVIMRLQDNVTSGLARIRNSMEETSKANQRMGRDISSAGRNVSALGEAMLPAAAGITALGAASVKTFMNFDQTITAAGVKAGATTEELNQMREAASKWELTSLSVPRKQQKAWIDWQRAASMRPSLSRPCLASSRHLLHPVRI